MNIYKLFLSWFS